MTLDELPLAIRDVAAERRRQVEKECFEIAHDDGYKRGQLALAAAAYAVSHLVRTDGRDPYLALLWPWSVEWWKPKDRRRELIKAGALIVAEIERIDRAALRARDKHEGRSSQTVIPVGETDATKENE